MIEVEWQSMELAREDGRCVTAARDVTDDVPEPHFAARCRRWIVERDAHHVGQHVAVLHMQELGILCAELGIPAHAFIAMISSARASASCRMRSMRCARARS